jgi:hypothetical protein
MTVEYLDTLVGPRKKKPIDFSKLTTYNDRHNYVYKIVSNLYINKCSSWEVI